MPTVSTVIARCYLHLRWYFFKYNLTMAAFSSVASQSSLLWSLQACYLKIELWKRILAMRLQTKLNKFQSAGGLVEEQD